MRTTINSRIAGRTVVKSFTTVSLGWAPTPSQYFILSTLHSTLLCGLLGSTLGRYIPKSSIGFAFRLFRWSTATRWKILSCLTPCTASRRRTVIADGLTLLMCDHVCVSAEPIKNIPRIPTEALLFPPLDLQTAVERSK